MTRAEVQIEKSRIRINLVSQFHLGVAGVKRKRIKVVTMEVPVNIGSRAR
jgi:hypothetical protein